MSVLCRAKKVRISNEDWQLIRLNPSHMEIFQVLELIPKPDDPPKKEPGPPKEIKNHSKTKEHNAASVTEAKRKRSRPKGSKNKPKANVDGNNTR